MGSYPEIPRQYDAHEILLPHQQKVYSHYLLLSFQKENHERSRETFGEGNVMNYTIGFGLAMPECVYFRSAYGSVLIWNGFEFRNKNDLDDNLFDAYRYCYDNYERIVEEVKSFIVKDML